MHIYDRLIERVFGSEIRRRVDLATRALDDRHDTLYGRSKDTYPRDRHSYDREEVLADVLEAWRVNPLARRIVELTSQYVVGGGISIESANENVDKFIGDWWNHRLNRMDTRVFDWCDELTRTGNLFLAVSTDPAGMSYVRAIPTADIAEIESAANDVEQERVIWEKPDPLGESSPGPDSATKLAGRLLGRRWECYDEDNDWRNEDGSFSPVLLHYAVNRPVGARWGESDLSAVLKWLVRYASWLEDRVRLNRFRQTFVYVVTGKYNSKGERMQRQREIDANPPNPGSILVADESEKWEVLHPELDSFEASQDGLSIKKMISAGSGNPLHFLAEPESSTRTTAESAGGPTFRHYEQRQLYFLWLLEDLTKVILRRRSLVDRRIPKKVDLKLRGSDISARDNAALAVASSTIVGAFVGLRDRGLIDDAELLRLAYRFCGEIIDVEEMLKRGEAAPPPKLLVPSAAGPTIPPGIEAGAGKSQSRPKTRTPTGRPAGVKIDPVTGDVKGADEA